MTILYNRKHEGDKHLVQENLKILNRQPAVIRTIFETYQNLRYVLFKLIRTESFQCKYN